MDPKNVPDPSKMSHDEKDSLIVGLLQRIGEIETAMQAQAMQAQGTRQLEALEQFTARVGQLEEMLEQRDQRIRQLERENQTLVRRLYGPKSDRPGDEAQLLLDGIIALENPSEEAGNEDEDDASDANDEDSKPKKKKKKKSTGRKLLPHRPSPRSGHRPRATSARQSHRSVQSRRQRASLYHRSKILLSPAPLPLAGTLLATRPRVVGTIHPVRLDERVRAGP